MTLIDERDGPPASPGFRTPDPPRPPDHELFQSLIAVLDKALREDRLERQAQATANWKVADQRRRKKADVTST